VVHERLLSMITGGLLLQGRLMRDSKRKWNMRLLGCIILMANILVACGNELTDLD